MYNHLQKHIRANFILFLCFHNVNIKVVQVECHERPQTVTAEISRDYDISQNGDSEISSNVPDELSRLDKSNTSSYAKNNVSQSEKSEISEECNYEISSCLSPRGDAEISPSSGYSSWCSAQGEETLLIDLSR